MPIDLDHGTDLFRVLSEPLRLRLLLLLTEERLSVAELTAITRVSQSRISSHLGRLRHASLVTDERVGSASFYSARIEEQDSDVGQLWEALVASMSDAQIRQDRERALEVVRQRSVRQPWAESVAGRMEHQYSPGRTWEATAHALISLLALGDVLDIASGDGVLGQMLARRAGSVTCLDINPTVIEAGRKRLADHRNVYFQEGDMHALPFDNASFDQTFLMHALSFTQQPQTVIEEAVRVLRPGGALVLATLREHNHRATVAAYDHCNLGFSPDQLSDWAQKAGLEVTSSTVTSREPRPPYFEVITLFGNKRA